MEIFYNSQKLFSYKRLYNLVINLRGKGKTYHFTKKCIEIGLKQKDISFIVLVRYKEDIRAIKDSWWCIVEDLFPEYTFSTQNNVIFASNGLEKFPIGVYYSLAQYVRYKKIPRPKVKLIMFDEFLNEENDYLSNEISAFLSICDSIIRHRDDCKVVLISNTISMLNPYFEYFGITKLGEEGRRFTKGQHNSIVDFVSPEDEDFINFRKQTQFGKSIEGTGYGAFALNGAFMLDDTTNVIPNPKGTYHYLYNLCLNGTLIAVYYVNGLLYFSVGKDSTMRTYTPFLEDAKNSNAHFVDKNFRYFEQIKNHILKNEVMYETLMIKNKIISFLKWKLGCTYEFR